MVLTVAILVSLANLLFYFEQAILEITNLHYILVTLILKIYFIIYCLSSNQILFIFQFIMTIETTSRPRSDRYQDRDHDMSLTLPSWRKSADATSWATRAPSSNRRNVTWRKITVIEQCQLTRVKRTLSQALTQERCTYAML
jgi:hypothetical protein